MLMRVHHNELASRPASNAEVSNLIFGMPLADENKLRNQNLLLDEKHNNVFRNTIFIINTKNIYQKGDKIMELNKHKKLPDI